MKILLIAIAFVFLSSPVFSQTTTEEILVGKNLCININEGKKSRQAQGKAEIVTSEGILLSGQKQFIPFYQISRIYVDCS